MNAVWASPGLLRKPFSYQLGNKGNLSAACVSMSLLIAEGKAT